MYVIDFKNDKSVKIFIKRKIHLIKNLKINMLINNDIIVSKNILINFKKQKIIVRNCDVTTLLKIRFKAVDVQLRSIHVKKNIILFSRT